MPPERPLSAQVVTKAPSEPEVKEPVRFMADELIAPSRHELEVPAAKEVPTKQADVIAFANQKGGGPGEDNRRA